MNSHDSFCRGVLSDVPTFLELARFLTTRDAELDAIFNLLDKESFQRIPGDFSDTEKTGYADLVFTAEVLPEFLTDKAKPVEVCVGFLVEHKSARDDDVLEQLRKYHYYLMETKLKANAERGIPSVAIILYNGRDNWNPLEKLKAYPAELRRYLLPFKSILLNVKDVSDQELDGFNARLAAFICSMKYIWNPESSRDTFRKVLERVRNDLPESDALDLLLQMDVYLKGWLKVNFMEAFKMDFVRPNYKTVGDVLREQEEAAKKAAHDIGREEGERIGREKGERIGREAGVKDAARKMLAKNKPLAEIVEFTGLSEEQVKALTVQKT